MICAPPIDPSDASKASSNHLADWLELEVLATETGTAPLSAINQNLEIDEDYEPTELDEENLVAERRVQQVLRAVEERKNSMGDAYPYVVDPTGVRLSLKPNITPGGYAYLFCLVVSNAASDGHLADSGPWLPDLESARRLFQVCATVSAAGLVRGPAYSVGWPRSDSTTFIEKLKQVYDEFGDGVVVDQIPHRGVGRVKDDGIDVIAWQHSHDKPAMGYFLGQAASGANWPDKALKGIVERFHGTWFRPAPACQVRVGTLMPFCLPSLADAEDHEDQEEIEGQLRRYTQEHGDVVFRHRIARYVDDGRALVGVGTIEGLAELDAVAAFVLEYRQKLQAAVDAL
jgi:hypothetical protein